MCASPLSELFTTAQSFLACDIHVPSRLLATLNSSLTGSCFPFPVGSKGSSGVEQCSHVSRHVTMQLTDDGNVVLCGGRINKRQGQALYL